MQFINIIVHSVDNMNFRVYLQYEFTQLGLDGCLEVSNLLCKQNKNIHRQNKMSLVVTGRVLFQKVYLKSSYVTHKTSHKLHG